jgi:hypothetical protein
MVPDGMPFSATEILPTGGTGRNGSALGTGADDGLIAHAVGWLGLELAGPALGVPGAQAAMEMVVAVIKKKLESCWRNVSLGMAIASYFWPG